MNSIVYTHVALTLRGISAHDVALHRLSAYLDAERDTLGRLLAQAAPWHAAAALERLDQLHLDPGATADELRDMLEEAMTCLEALLQTVRAMSGRRPLQTAWGLPGTDAFERHVCWSGARLEDVVATLRHALAA